MKTIKYLIFSLMAAFAVGCSGNVDDVEELEDLVLYADVDEIIADGSSAVSFTVMYGDEDVTASASVKCVSGNSDVSGSSFTTEAIGTYVFRAFYEDAVSEDVEVEAKTRFLRRVCVMEFTGTWCAQCPEGATTLNFLTTRTYKDKAFVLAFHNDDPYALPVEKELHTMFGCSSYPAYVTDMRDAGLLTAYYVDGGVFRVSYKDEQVKRVLTKAGLVLELKLYLVARAMTDKDGTPFFSDVRHGVFLDWDGEESAYESENEVDLVLMRGVVPLFVSCKNGFLSSDECYKLSTVTEKFGGKYAKKMLAASALHLETPFGRHIAQRCQDMGVWLLSDLPSMTDEEIAAAIRGFFSL